MTPKQELIDDSQMIPSVLKAHPETREVFDRYGLRGCGGPLGPAETIGYFARAHGINLDRLLPELNAACEPAAKMKTTPVAPPPIQSHPEDAIYRPFVLAALACVMFVGAGFGSWMLLNIARGENFWALSFFELNGHAHVMIFGWISLFIMGFGYQAFPRFGHTSLRWPSLAWGSLALMVTGILLTVASQILHTSRAALGLALSGGVCEVFATLLFATVVIGTRAKSLQPRQTWEVWLVAGLGWLVLGAVGEAIHLAWLLSAPDFASQIDRVATWQTPLRTIQFHGFALCFVLGVSQRMLPAMFGWTAVSPSRSRIALALVTAGVIAEAVCFPLYRLSGTREWIYGSWAGTLLTALGVLLIATAFCLHKKPEFGDRATKFIRSAYVWGVVALVLAVLTPLYNQGIRGAGFSHAWLDASRHAFALGFLSLMIIGVSSKVVATLNGVPATRLPALWTPFFLLNAAIGLRVAGAISSDWFSIGFPIAALSGPLAAAGIAIYGVHVLQLIRMGSAEPASAVTTKTPAQVQPAAPSCDCCSSHEDAHNPLEYAHDHSEETASCASTCSVSSSHVAPEDITAETKVGWLVDEDPRTLPVFFQHGFHMLSNPVLRRTVARQTSIAQAIRFHGGSLELLLSDLRESVSDRSPSCSGTCTPQ